MTPTHPLIERAHSLYKQYERFVPAAAFGFGFLFDVLTLQRIDELATLLQQAIYLLIAIALITVELIGQVRAVTPPRPLRKLWQYREFFLHFVLGSLLSSYVIFYFKSASALTSFIFIGLLAALLTINEFMRFGKSQIQVHMAMISMSLISYFASLIPILLGFIGFFPFLLSVATSVAVLTLLYRYLKPKLRGKDSLIRTEVLIPSIATHLIFIALYMAHVIPPVPLSVSYMGIYHGVEKKNGNYILTYTHPWWRFWENGDETFLARPGDQLIGFAQVYSPTRFKEKLQFRWSSLNARGNWEPQDAIPIEVSGGREEGFRIAIIKKNYHPGEWRMHIETRDNREVGRLGFTIISDESTTQRSEYITVR